MGNNIILPYSGQIVGGIHEGTDVVINGRPHHNCNRFSVNLCIGPTYDQDCALHFNPRFDSGHVVRNHHQGGSWGREETAGGNPFHKGHNFDLHIKVHSHGYKITVNNRHFCDFHHRLPKESVRYIYIEGEVTINFIQFRGQHQHHPHHHHHKPGFPSAPGFPSGPSFPPAPSYPTGQSFPPAPTPGYPPAPGYPAGGAAPGGPIFNPSVPFTTPIPGGMYPGRTIVISGTPNHHPSRFSINLACGPYDSADFGLHMDVRFNYGNDRNVVIRTHKQGGNYGSEEKHQNYFPFFPNTSFEIMILAEPNCFKIAVNNQHFCEFFHRIQPMQRVDHVMVLGDVRLSQVRFQ